MTDARYDAIVVGGGHNGLVASFYLARAGLRVVTLERRDFVGGACATEELFPGYRVSSCSYVCWMLQPKVLGDMALERHGLTWQHLDPVTFNPYRDGSHAFFWNDDARTQESIARLNQHDADAYPQWNAFWYRAAGLLNPFLLQDPPTLDDVRAYAARVGEEELLDRVLTTPLADICAEHFEDTRVQAALVQVEDIGDPWKPGSAWTETYFHCGAFTGFGYSVVTGGMGAITAAMAAAVREQGGEIRTGSEVERILVDDNGRARGVRLAGGEELAADVVLSNADPKRTLLRLVEPGALPDDVGRRVEGLSTKTSYYKWHGVLGRLPDTSRYQGRQPEPREVSYIHIAPSLEHYRRAHQEASRGGPPREPIVHIQIPTVYDGSLTDRDGHVVSMWILYAPPHLATGSWDDRREEVGNQLIDYVTEFIPNFRQDLKDWVLFTPEDLEARVGLTDGNIRHLDTLPDQFLSGRPLEGAGYATAIEGLYLCDAGTHPGGEVTGAPGHNAAHAVLRDLAKRSSGVASAVYRASSR